MQIFNIHGGARLDGRKSLTAHLPIVPSGMPPLLHIPLQQHIGTSTDPIVHTGERVLKGQLLAFSKSVISAPIHSPTSGIVKRIGEYPAPHPSGLPVITVTLEPDGLDEWAELPAPLDLDTASQSQIADRVSAAGIVGMGGATFPSAVKLNLGLRYDLETLVINGAECEPYLTCDDRLMQERSDKTVLGIGAMMKALGVEKCLIAIEANKPEAFAAMELACKARDGVSVVHVPARYPMGSEKHLVQALTGRETPAASLTADLGVVVHNAATAYAVYEAVYLGRPLISRVVTVSGRAITNPGNYEALIGTPVAFLVEQSGGMAKEPKRLLMGGPMMGQPLLDLDVPVIKGTSGILALAEEEMHDKSVMPCIGCGSCVIVCPVGLLPLDMASRIQHDDVEGADDIGVRDCVSCGSCNYVCPSYIPLVQYFNYAKGHLKERDIEKTNQERMKILTERREHREEKARERLEQKYAEQRARKNQII